MVFECSQKWDEMPASIDPNIRRCSDCKRDVHFCHTVEDLDRAINKHQCVAFISGEAMANDEALKELISNIDDRKKQMFKHDRQISITTGIPRNYRGGKAFLELDDEDPKI
jgi:hypothetical protein